LINDLLLSQHTAFSGFDLERYAMYILKITILQIAVLMLRNGTKLLLNNEGFRTLFGLQDFL